MLAETAKGLILPFLGTAAGAATVFFMKKDLSPIIKKALNGFAAGVMIAASIWSLLIPAMEQSEQLGVFSFLPAATGFWLGILFLLLIDHIVPHIHIDNSYSEGPKTGLSRTAMMILAVTIHNFPEGMAIGAVYTGVMNGSPGITLAAAMALSVGIAVQNFPEGAIVSMPLHASGMSKTRSFFSGILSGIVEPIGSVLTIIAASFILPFIPYTLGFAAGAMIYVVVEELIPEITSDELSDVGTLFFAVGFTVMMTLDVVFG